jgi:hypothetical protein
MRIRSLAIACTVFGLLVGTALADDFWTKKDWTQWSKGDCNKILQNSPWGKTGKVENGSSASSGPSVTHDAGSANMGNTLQGTGELDYYVSIYSAPPVQSAVLRQMQIDEKYDKKSDADKKAFDQKAQSDLPKFKDDEIAFRVGYFSSKLDLVQGVGRFWQELIPQGSVPQGAYLITEDGRKIEPDSYQATKLGEFFIAFPKQDGGKPTIADGTKSFKVQITSPSVGDFSTAVVTVEFKLDQTKWQDKAVF